MPGSLQPAGLSIHLKSRAAHRYAPHGFYIKQFCSESVQSRSVKQRSDHLVSEILCLLLISIGNSLGTKQALGDSDTAGASDVDTILLKDTFQLACAGSAVLGQDNQRNVGSSCGRKILAEFDQFGVDLAIVFKAEQNQNLTLAGICGRDLVPFYLVSTGNSLTDNLRIFQFAFFFSE